MHRYSGGQPKVIAEKVYELVREELIYWKDDDTGWCIEEETLLSPAWAEQFQTKLYQPIRDFENALDKPTALQVKTFLRLAALCVKNVPVGLLVRHRGIPDGDETEVFLSLIHRHFVADGSIGLFLTYEDEHPSFPGQLIYAWRQPILRWAILKRSEDQLEALATTLLNFLSSTLPLHTRGIAELYSELAHLVEAEEVRQRFDHLVACWVALDDADKLTETLIHQLNTGKADGLALLKMLDAAIHWPLYRRLAVLNAILACDEAVPFGLLAVVYCRRAATLHEASKFKESLSDAEAALNLCPTEPSELTVLLHLIASKSLLGLRKYPSSGKSVGELWFR